MSLVERHSIKVMGTGPETILFAHGYGCDQAMWRYITPAFLEHYRVILFDYVGAGKSDLTQYDRQKYGSLDGYADDVLEIIRVVSGRPVIFIGHSVSAMIGVIAAKKNPSAFEKLVMIGPSPCYINDGKYVGGFSRKDIDGLLQTLDENHLGWSRAMAPVIMKNAGTPEFAAELAESFCRTDPEIAKHFARVTFLADNRADLEAVKTSTLILQCSNDAIAPDQVGEFVHRRLSNSKLTKLGAEGHCPHVSAPEETIHAIKSFLGQV